MPTDAVVRPGADETELWHLMSGYNWDDGFTVPLAVVRHPRCDRALALRLFWELDDSARIHHSDEVDALRESYSAEMRHAPEEFERIVAYATTLVDRLRLGDFPDGANEFDTGFMDHEVPGTTERQRKIRAMRTKRALTEYEEAFLRPAIRAS